MVTPRECAAVVNDSPKPRFVCIDGSESDYSIPLTPENIALSALCVMSSNTMDLQRKYSARLEYQGPIESGMIFSWEPRNGYAAEVIEVIELIDGKVLVRSRQHCPGDHWVAIDRFREAVVLSRFKALPDRQGAI